MVGPRTWVVGRDTWLCRELERGLGELVGPTGVRRVSARDLEELAPALATAFDSGPGLRLVIDASLACDDRGIPSVPAARRLYQLCAERDPEHVVVLSSFAVHEPNHHHPGMVAEGFSRARRFGNRISEAWRGLEGAAREAFESGFRWTILRLATVPSPDGRCVLSRRLRGRLAGVAPGRDPQIQLLAPEDVISAVALALERRPDGVFQVAPNGAVPLRAALRLAGVLRAPVPLAVSRMLFATGRRARRRRARDELDFLRFPATQSDDALRRLGYRPRWSSAQVALRWSERRATGAAPSPRRPPPSFDDWGLSERFVSTGGRTIFRFLRRVWFRAEIEGIERVPRDGPALLVGTHRGFVPLDAMLALDASVRERGRWPRFLVHPGLLRWPYVATVIVRLGGVVACRENAERLLSRGDVLGVFPEGLRGPFRLLRDAHRVGRFLSDDFVAWAARFSAPVVPFVTVGPAESFPIVGKIESRWWRRRTEWPFFPLLPFSPFLPFPMPVKWRMRFLDPLAVDASDAATSASRRASSERVRETLQRALSALLAERRSVLRG